MSERKKILWLVSWYPNKNDLFDGDFIQRHARAASLVHDIHVLYVGEADIEKAVEEEVTVAMGLTEQRIYFRKPGLFHQVRKNWLWQQHFRRGIRHYINKNGIPFRVHVHIPWKAGLQALWIKKKWGVPFLVTEHWGMYRKSDPHSIYRHSPVTRRLLNTIYSAADSCTAVSEYLARGIEDLTGRKSSVLPNVVDTTLFRPGEEKYNKFSFVHVSNMAPVKNIPLILQAFSEVVDSGAEAQLILIGNRNQEYVRLADEMKLLDRKVFFRGEVSYREVSEEMRRCHALVMASQSETFSCVTAEALCSGLPVVATETGALPELVNGANGLLVPPGDRKALARALETMIRDHGSFRETGLAREAERKYGYTALSGQFEALYGAS